jgi:uncharacterized membrane protein
MTLKERLKAEETKIGKILKNWVATGLLLCSIFGGANEYLSILPPDFIPTWLKTVVVITGIVSFVGGKLTVKKPDEQTPKN